LSGFPLISIEPELDQDEVVDASSDQRKSGQSASSAANPNCVDRKPSERGDPAAIWDLSTTEEDGKLQSRESG
jgi:hypothetical protein